MNRLLLIIVVLCCCGYCNAYEPGDTLKVAYKLHGQTRRFKMVFDEGTDGSITLHWNIIRNMRLWEGSYTMSADAVANGCRMSYLMPEDGNNVALPGDETYMMLSRRAFVSLRENGRCDYSGVTFVATGTEDTLLGPAIAAYDPDEGARICVLDNSSLPIIISMADNPLEINWSVQ